MAIWSNSKRSEVTELLRTQALSAHRLIAFAHAMATHRIPSDVHALLAGYISGACSFEDHLHYAIRDLINKVGIQTEIIPPGGSAFDDTLAVKTDIVASRCPELMSSLYPVRDNTELEQIVLLRATSNELVDSRLPGPMNMLLRRPDRPAVYAYATRDATVYAHPHQYQMMSKDRTTIWTSGSPRSLSRAAVGQPDLIAWDKDIVVVQDRFNCTNFAHFLFDSVTRALLLNERMGGLDSAILVFGGVPSEFHHIICGVLSHELKLDERSIYFPARGVMLQSAGRCFWFSDQVEAYVHPAQMAHPVSVDLLRQISERTQSNTSSSEHKRIYVSRSDAMQRRVTNEEEIALILKQLGFVIVQLSRLSASQQIGLFRNAEIVVAPHGMGLTHLAFSERLQGVIELFSPNAGSDTYAFIAKAFGVDYDFIIGNAVDSSTSDFNIDVDELLLSVRRLQG